jgi:hypothetical protein
VPTTRIAARRFSAAKLARSSREACSLSCSCDPVQKFAGTRPRSTGCFDERQSDKVRTFNRREAQSRKVSFGDPVILRDSSRSRVQFVPFFVRRSDGTELALKIITYRKNLPPSDWVLVEEKSLSLNESEGRQLRRALRDHLAVAESDQDGRYILIRVDQGTASLGDNDPAAVAAALAKVLSQNEIVRHLAATELSESLINAFRGAIRLNEMRSAVVELRNLLDSNEGTEERYQAWCKEHSWAFGNAYVMSDDVRDISTGDSIDLLLPTVISGYRDIVELKRPDREVRSTTVPIETSSSQRRCHARWGRSIAT